MVNVQLHERVRKARADREKLTVNEPRSACRESYLSAERVEVDK